VAGLIINKFRGSRQLLQPAVDFLEQRTGKAVLGVLPYLDVNLEAEDSQVLPERRSGGIAEDGEELRICALRLPRVSNFTDLDPLRTTPGTVVDWVQEPAEVAGADALVIPGSKNTAADLRWLWYTGLGAAVERLAARGVPVVGICGGYQMLGTRVLDPAGHESHHIETAGLGLLNVETVFAPAADKVSERTTARVAQKHGPFAALFGTTISGYELHMGRTSPGPHALPLFQAERAAPGAAILGVSDETGQVWGTYLHEVFHNDAVRRSWIAWLRRRRGLPPLPDCPVDSSAQREETFDRLAAAVRANLDMERVYAILGVERG